MIIVSICSVFRDNMSPYGTIGIISKDIEFFGTNIFIYNNGPAMRVCYVVMSDDVVTVHRLPMQNLLYMGL